MVDRSKYPEGERQMDVPVYKRTNILLTIIGVGIVIGGLVMASWVAVGVGAFLIVASIVQQFLPSWFHSSG